MRAFAALHPLTLVVYFMAVLLPMALCMHPVLLALSLLGAVALYRTRRRFSLRSCLTAIGLFLFFTALNPLFSHRGATVLLVVNDQPVTLEATAWGAAAAGMLLSALYWMRTFSMVMTADQWMALLGGAFPRLSLLLSLSLRLVSLLRQRLVQVRAAQRCVGLYKEESALGRIRGECRVFSVLTVWALENGVITADSMSARGYDIGRRTAYTDTRLTRGDAVYLALTLAFALPVAAALAAGGLRFAYYPHVAADIAGQAVALSAYACLALLPSVWEGVEKLRWRCLRSSI